MPPGHVRGDMVEQGHLGGFRAGGDDATFYPELWEWLVEHVGFQSVLDVGCGDGQAIDYFAGLGCFTLGLEGIPQDHPRIVQHDFTLGPWQGVPEEFDLVWSCEFVEHVEEQYVPFFLEAFKSAPVVLMTHAEPGQAGHHHVNLRDSSYWIGVMAGAGYQLDMRLTSAARVMASANKSEFNHFRRAGLGFRRYE